MAVGLVRLVRAVGIAIAQVGAGDAGAVCAGVGHFGTPVGHAGRFVRFVVTVPLAVTHVVPADASSGRGALEGVLMTARVGGRALGAVDDTVADAVATDGAGVRGLALLTVQASLTQRGRGHTHVFQNGDTSRPILFFKVSRETSTDGLGHPAVWLGGGDGVEDLVWERVCGVRKGCLDGTD